MAGTYFILRGNTNHYCHVLKGLYKPRDDGFNPLFAKEK